MARATLVARAIPVARAMLTVQGRPWVRANMIESADGAAAVDGLSGGLGGSADHEIFGLLRALAGVILVGAGTVRAERYHPARVAPRWAALRAGRPDTPPIAVLSAPAGPGP